MRQPPWYAWTPDHFRGRSLPCWRCKATPSAGFYEFGTVAGDNHIRCERCYQEERPMRALAVLTSDDD